MKHTVNYRIDEFTRQHLSDWVRREYPTDKTLQERSDAIDVYMGIMAFVEKHPVVLERGDSWQEIKRLVDRVESQNGPQ